MKTEIIVKYAGFGLIILAVVFEVFADVLFKVWASNNKSLILYGGLALYFVGTIFWAYSLKFEYLSKAVSIFTVLNFILVALVGVLYFQESLSFLNKLGILLGIASVIFLSL